MDEAQRDAVLNTAHRAQMTVAVSALTGEGVGELLQLIDSQLADNGLRLDVILEPEEGEALAWLHDHGHVLDRKANDDGTIRLVLILPEADLGRLEKKFPSLFARIALPIPAAD